MSEYRNTYKINPINLNRKDLIKLEDILKESVPDGYKYKLTIRTKYYDETITSDSIMSFLSKEIPDSNDNLFVEFMIREEFEIYATIYINLNKSYGELLISSNNKTWFYGTKKILWSFFTDRKPSYNKLKKVISYIPYFLPSIVIGFLILTFIVSDIKYKLLFLILTTVFLFLSVFAYLVEMHQKYLPFIKIDFKLNEKESLTGHEKSILYATILGSIVSLGSFIIMLINQISN